MLKTLSGCSLLAAAFCAVLLSLAAPAAAADQAPAAQFVQHLGDTALMSLTSKNLTRKTREARVRKILEDNFDITAIGRFAIGPYWRQATEAQRQEYMKFFEDLIVETYTTRFEAYSGQTLKVFGAQPSGRTDYIVDSSVIQKDAAPVGLQWRVRKEGAGLRVVDVIVAGVSMSFTQRSDFMSVIQNNGGLDGLISDLRQRHEDQRNKG
ncbi:MAG: ABC transporter substrate-binding protein [Alphaproteobacteria bacterium]|nr:ABC transporter substrate-binding protein [Alphaproteobacteria bacterium]